MLRSEVCSERKCPLWYVHAYTRQGTCTHREVLPMAAGTTNSSSADANTGHEDSVMSHCQARCLEQFGGQHCCAPRQSQGGTETSDILIGFRQTSPSSSPAWPSQQVSTFITFSTGLGLASPLFPHAPKETFWQAQLDSYRLCGRAPRQWAWAPEMDHIQKKSEKCGHPVIRE